MSAWTLCSCLAPQSEAFINLRRLSGTEYHSAARLMGYVDGFLVEQGVQLFHRVDHLGQWLARVAGQDQVEFLTDQKDFSGMDINIRCLALKASQRLMNHDA